MHFGKAYVGWLNQGILFEDAVQWGKRVCEQDVATRLVTAYFATNLIPFLLFCRLSKRRIRH
jgi:hypothetical protein